MEKDKQRSEELISGFVLMDETDIILSVLLGVACGLVVFFIALLDLQQGRQGHATAFFVAGVFCFFPFVYRLSIVQSKLNEEQARLCLSHNWHPDAREILQINLQKTGFIRCSDVIEAHHIHRTCNMLLN
jgi:hypothetical protein